MHAAAVHFAVGDGGDRLGIFGGHADEGDHPHVKKGARTAEEDGCRDARDITGAHRSGQCRGQGFLGLNIPLP